MIIVTIKGVMTVPEAEALMPTMPCMNSGTNIIAPNIPMLIKKPMPLTTVNVLFLNKRTGRIGSLVFDSIHTKAVKEIADSTNMPIIGQDVHANSVPPNVKASSSETTPMIIVAIPATSNRTGPSALTPFNPSEIRIVAIIPTGKLM